jgi:hypothetical protein
MPETFYVKPILEKGPFTEIVPESTVVENGKDVKPGSGICED